MRPVLGMVLTGGDATVVALSEQPFSLRLPRRKMIDWLSLTRGRRLAISLQVGRAVNDQGLLEHAYWAGRLAQAYGGPVSRLTDRQIAKLIAGHPIPRAEVRAWVAEAYCVPGWDPDALDALAVATAARTVP